MLINSLWSKIVCRHFVRQREKKQLYILIYSLFCGFKIQSLCKMFIILSELVLIFPRDLLKNKKFDPYNCVSAMFDEFKVLINSFWPKIVCQHLVRQREKKQLYILIYSLFWGLKIRSLTLQDVYHFVGISVNICKM